MTGYGSDQRFAVGERSNPISPTSLAGGGGALPLQCLPILKSNKNRPTCLVDGLDLLFPFLR